MQQIELELAGGGVLTVYLRASLDAMPAVKERPLVLVVPGGGYGHVSPREGDPVTLQFAAAGYHTAVLTYSVGEGAQNYQPLRQLNEALALLRQNAGEWHILPDKIAVCGFSAGGHLALSGAVLDIPGETAQQRPNAVILGYPVITAGEFAHRGSFVQLAGSEDAAAQQAFTLEDKVTSDTPPVFVWHTMEDKTVPVENTLLLLAALRSGCAVRGASVREGRSRHQHQHRRSGCCRPSPRPLGGSLPRVAGGDVWVQIELNLDIPTKNS